MSEPISTELDRIAQEAASEEAATEAAQPGAEPAAPAIDPGIAWAQIPTMVGGILAMALPEVKAAYTEDACLNWGRAMAAVSEKYGWEAGEVMSRFAPEIALTIASVPLVLPVAAAVKVRRIEAEKKRAKAQDAETVTEVAPAQELTAGGLPEPGGFVDPV